MERKSNESQAQYIARVRRRRDKVLKLIAAGKSRGQIARMFGISRQRVWQIEHPKEQ
jgi:DNA-binding CsgD family transcriptional regulator